MEVHGDGRTEISARVELAGEEVTYRVEETRIAGSVHLVHALSPDPAGTRARPMVRRCCRHYVINKNELGFGVKPGGNDRTAERYRAGVTRPWS